MTMRSCSRAGVAREVCRGGGGVEPSPLPAFTPAAADAVLAELAAGVPLDTALTTQGIDVGAVKLCMAVIEDSCRVARARRNSRCTTTTRTALRSSIGWWRR